MDRFNYHAIVVEDDPAIANLLKIHLLEIGLTVDVYFDAESALLSLASQEYHLGLLDWMLPGIHGIDLIRKIRSRPSEMKILMLTAKTDADSIVQALESGADDYLAKPFDQKVLLARVRNLVRRIDFERNVLKKSAGESVFQAEQNAPDEIEFNGLSIHFLEYSVKFNNIPIHLTPSEFKLIAALFKSQGRVLTRDRLMALIQGDDVSVTARTIDTHIFALRKKLGIWSNHIETIRGIGYRILISSQDQSTTAEAAEV